MTAKASDIEQQCIRAGAFRCGFARVAPVDDGDFDEYNAWIGQGNNADMTWMADNNAIRNNPAMLLDNAKTLVVCLFNYHSQIKTTLSIAEYARGWDYHYVLRNRLASVTDYIIQTYGGDCRICIDSAPLRERFWARKAGLGFLGRNGMLTVPNIGSSLFIATILWTGEVDNYSTPYIGDGCGTCRRCLDACPNRALLGNGNVDCRRCLSYLTIESTKPIPPDIDMVGKVFGCDICQGVCPHNSKTPITTIDEFALPHPAALLNADNILSMSGNAFRRATFGSPLARVRLHHLKQIINGG